MLNATIGQSSGGSSGQSISNNSSYTVGGTWGTGATASAQSYSMMQEANKFNSSEAEKNRLFNAEQAEINRKWQENMSNTAYQRAVKDMQKAGINPILAYTNGGASTGTGATASGGQATSAMGNAYTDTYNESQGQGKSESHNSSWENSFTTSDIANQLSAITGVITDTINQIQNGTQTGTTGEQVKQAFNEVRNKYNSGMNYIDNAIESVKTFFNQYDEKGYKKTNTFKGNNYLKYEKGK